MPGRPYSTRFILSSGSGGLVTYAVPVGQRAVIKAMSCFNPNANASNVVLSIAGIAIWIASVPGGSGLNATGLMIVVNGGESMGISATFANVPFQVAGYLFQG